MGSLVAAYLVAWAVVCVYIGRLAAQNASLTRRLDELEARKVERSKLSPRARAA